ncbi:MAG: biotin/lipoyl-binding protein [Oscillospiraceae bacterium]|nr:biotin/lipoyl-binding protein [Oscillospiraceae bacterium]
MIYKITLNDKLYEVKVEKGEAAILGVGAAPVAAANFVPAPAVTVPTTSAPAPASSGGGNAVVSPLPGTIVAIKVAVGDRVEKGQMLIIIEAMKMESTISAPNAGVIAEILTTAGANVQSGTPLLRMQ